MHWIALAAFIALAVFGGGSRPDPYSQEDRT